MQPRTNQSTCNDPATAACLVCDTARVSGAKFCPECGQGLQEEGKNQAPMAEPTLTTEPVLEDQVPAAATPPDEPATTVIPPREPVTITETLACSCGVQLPREARFCLHCGKAVNEPDENGLRLVCIGGPNDGLTRQLNGADITIGSGEQCDLVLADDAYVSRRHVRVSSDDNAMVMVEDLASSNGTLLRIRRPIMLEAGDEILVGTAVLRLEQSNKSGD